MAELGVDQSQKLDPINQGDDRNFSASLGVEKWEEKSDLERKGLACISWDFFFFLGGGWWGEKEK